MAGVFHLVHPVGDRPTVVRAQGSQEKRFTRALASARCWKQSGGDTAPV